MARAPPLYFSACPLYSSPSKLVTGKSWPLIHKCVASLTVSNVINPQSTALTKQKILSASSAGRADDLSLLEKNSEQKSVFLSIEELTDRKIH